MIYLEYNKLFFPSPGYLQDFVFKRERESSCCTQRYLERVGRKRQRLQLQLNFRVLYFIREIVLFKSFFFSLRSKTNTKWNVESMILRITAGELSPHSTTRTLTLRRGSSSRAKPTTALSVSYLYKLTHETYEADN